MTTDHSQLTPEEARERLAATRSRSLRSTVDRRVHAIGTAVFGLSMGAFAAVRTVVSGTGEILLTLAYAAALIAVVAATERAARTRPRRAGRWSRLGIGGSLVVALVLVLPWLNLQAQDGAVAWPALLAGALVVALPSLVAAAGIARGRA